MGGVISVLRIFSKRLSGTHLAMPLKLCLWLATLGLVSSTAIKEKEAVTKDLFPWAVGDFISTSSSGGEVNFDEHSILPDEPFKPYVFDLCVRCNATEFQCDQKCINKLERCDGDPDCFDGSDEADCSYQGMECSPDKVRCGQRCVYHFGCPEEGRCREMACKLNDFMARRDQRLQHPKTVWWKIGNSRARAHRII